jgi:sugar lactone lactonase YvrE
MALALDDKNVLLRDNAGNKTAVSLPQQAQKPGHFVALSSFDPDVYLLDTANSQVWRYPYAVSSFSPTQAAYWDTSAPNLSDGVSLAFGKQLLYVLKANGSILKFDFQSNPLKFTVNLKTPLTKPNALYTDPGQRWIWVADPQHGRIVQLDSEGGYSRTYVSSTSSMDFSQIRSIAVGPDGKTIYVLTGTKLFDFPVVS